MKYPDDYINKIICGDCLEVMKGIPDKAVDLVLTDPPYNIGFTYDEHEDNLSEEMYMELLSHFQYPFRTVMIHYPEETMQYLVPALGIPEEVMVWCYNSNLPKQSRLINFFNCMPDKTKVLQPYKNPDDSRIAELIANGKSGTPIYDWFSDIQLVKNVSKGENGHPCPMPLELMERIILMTTKEGDIVLDPFSGSGTTCLAAKKLGRRFIGIEKSEKYIEIAQRRLAQEYLFT